MTLGDSGPLYLTKLGAQIRLARSSAMTMPVDVNASKALRKRLAGQPFSAARPSTLARKAPSAV